MTPLPAPPPLLVETPEALAALSERLAKEPRVAIDTEADSLHKFRERVCVVQISVPGLDAILDPLAVTDLSPLKRIAARPDALLVMHGGDYDISVLSRDHGFSFVNVFDTMIAATLLGDEKVGLQALVDQAFGVHLSKKHQTADWGRRPFTDEQVNYLRSDTSHLLALHDIFSARLREADLVEEAAIEFRRLAARRGTPWTEDPEAWRRAKGAEKLDALGRAVFEALWGWREEKARAHDVPRFRVLPNESMLAAAARPPSSVEDLRRLTGGATIERVGDAPTFLAAIVEGLGRDARGEAPPGFVKVRKTPEEASRADIVRRREERLKRWRTAEALARKVPNVVVLPNPAILAVTENPPESVDALAALPDVGPKRAAMYGEKILELLQ